MKTLIILDWDDTLFPTTWILKNNIDVNNGEIKNKYIVYFAELDNVLYKVLINLMKYGTVTIVTNAMTKWVFLSSDIIPNTRNLIKKYIKIISARDMYQKKIPEMEKWKKLVFEQVVTDHFMNKHFIENIISVGDAKYEFNALVDLHSNFKKKKRFLKSIRFMSSPTYESLIDQLEVLNNCVHKVCTSKKHMDLLFETF